MSRSLLVRVEYTDGSFQEMPIEEWPSLRSEGVDRVIVREGELLTIRQGASLYWIYFEDQQWIFGSGSIRYDPNPVEEVVFKADGCNRVRWRSFLPDLQHAQVKLGWWHSER